MSRIILTMVGCSVLLHLASAYEYVEGGRRGEGDSCDENGQAGTCTRRTECHVFLERGHWWLLKICGFHGNDTVICCPIRATTTTIAVTTPKPATTTPPSGTSTTEYMPMEYEYELVEDPDDECSLLSPSYTTEPVGQKSFDKCIEYQMDLIYPCEESQSLLGGKVRSDYCKHKAHALIVGGKDATQDEFPHMVLLGYGRTEYSAVWLCGGTLISDRFILTAAHCTRAKGHGYVNYVIVGSLRRTEAVQPWQVYHIKRIIKHPAFNPYTKKNDIALLETDPIRLGPSVVPACLDVFGGDRYKVVATGWGARSYMGRVADTLQKVTLTEFTDRECTDYYPVKSGSTFDNTTQSCYGDYDRRADTCQGDSGGPLTISNHRLHCMYTVVGITSFGAACGIPGQPGWYTKVSNYVPWIESIVWA